MSRRHAGVTTNSCPEKQQPSSSQAAPEEGFSQDRRPVGPGLFDFWRPRSRVCLSDRAFRRFQKRTCGEVPDDRMHSAARYSVACQAGGTAAAIGPRNDGPSRAICKCRLYEVGRVVGRRHVRCPGAPAATSVRGVSWDFVGTRSLAMGEGMDHVVEVAAVARVVQAFTSRFLFLILRIA